MTKRERTIWHLEVSSILNMALEAYLPLSEYSTKTEFIRTAVREKLEFEVAQKKQQLGDKVA